MKILVRFKGFGSFLEENAKKEVFRTLSEFSNIGKFDFQRVFEPSHVFRRIIRESRIIQSCS